MVPASSTLNKPLVCDIGASSIKVGFAGRLVPDAIVPCVTAEYRNNHWKIYEGVQRKALLANDALEAGKRQKVGYKYPFNSFGEVCDWKQLEVLLREAFRCLGVEDASSLNVLITKPNKMKRDDLKTLLDLFHFTFGFRAVTMHEQAALVLYTQGVETGVVVEMGESMTHITPVYKGHAIPKADKLLSIGGRAIIQHLLKLLRLKGFPLNDQEDIEVGRQIKEQYCFVSTDLDLDDRLASETTALFDSLKLIDGTTISLSRERFEAPEAFFKPAMLSCESTGLADMIFEVIQNADIDCRADLYRNIILSGGSSLLHGMQERLNVELNHLYKREVLHGEESRSVGWTPQILAPHSRQHLVFEGATLFADLIAEETSFWVTASEYSQGGIDCVLEKCNIHGAS